MAYVKANLNEVEIIEDASRSCASCDFDGCNCAVTAKLFKDVTYDAVEDTCKNRNGYVHFKIGVWAVCTDSNIVLGGTVRRIGSLTTKTITYIPNVRTNFMIGNGDETYEAIGRYEIRTT